ncbi:MAG: uridine kinase [Acidobacteria bacterium]|nr:MAG: uridine kinase [Acidobacteriota bacterium]REK04024.1 MAG: uridine kinase [Acidobacteriota bacterium]REK15186.1 MAG: uridine kinase [Acidobacteriota bacterium]REK46276.1 MAG: uridine kinase [Acidobacteriota bacterium]
MIIGICGGTGSGKTTIANKIVGSVGPENVNLIEQDSYYRNLADMPLDDRRQANFDHPDAVDNDLMINHLKRLIDGYPVEVPQYDFTTHTRMPNSQRLEPRTVTIVEGILIFNIPRLLEFLDLKVFVDTPDDIRLVRRIRRDMEERGRTLEQTLHQYEETIRPMHYEFVEPSKRQADIIIPEGTQIGITIELLCGLIREQLRSSEKSGV